jgi:hypothetical protein
VLGIGRHATESEIRAAYRDRARRAHPDRSGSAEEMAMINEAYRVLRDPARRADYDRSSTGAAPQSRPSPGDSWSTRTVQDPTPHLEPARIPWRLMIAMAVVGVGLVIAGAAAREDPAPPTLDGILRPGSCVEVSSDGLAVEVECASGDRLVVAEIVGFEQRCPAGTVGYLDRQGLGLACVRPAED